MSHSRYMSPRWGQDDISSTCSLSSIDTDNWRPPGGGKAAHKLKEGVRLFPLHTALYVVTVLAALFMAAVGLFLVICGLYSSTGVDSVRALGQRPYPNILIDGREYKVNLLATIKYLCIVFGSLSLGVCILMAWCACCLHRLLWQGRPWAWNRARRSGDQCLVRAGIRYLSVDEQVNMLEEEQRREVFKYKMGRVQQPQIV